MSRMSAPVGPRPIRLESAQLPANAAPNTSAPMRIAALITASTWIQTILRSLLRSLMAHVTLGAGQFLAMGPGGGGNVPETDGPIKPEFGARSGAGRRPRSLRQAFARVVGPFVAPLAHQLFELGVAAVGQHDPHRRQQIAGGLLAG